MSSIPAVEGLTNPAVTPNGMVSDIFTPDVSHGVESAPVTASTESAIASTIKILPADFYAPFFSHAANNRLPSLIRGLLPLEDTPGVISLLSGKPNPDTFPFTSFTFTARSPINSKEDTILTIEGKELAQGLQYGPTAGEKQLISWIEGLQEFSHGRKKNEGWRVSIGTGSQDLIFKAVTALVNPGDSVLLETPTYAGVIPMFHNLDCDKIEVGTDEHGISASALRSILENWPAGKPKPKVLYTVPYGCNPTGMTATLERRKEVLLLAREHNFIILEDDPYYYLYYGTAPRYPSYFALELEEPEVGRVLRFDSLSKILSAGIRLGFVSGPAPLVQAIDQCTSTSNLQTPSLTQIIIYKLLNSWGYDGFKIHTENVSVFYREKRDIFERAMRTHLSGLVEWSPPVAGMFIWFKLLLNGEPGEEEDSYDVILSKGLERGVLALPGAGFFPNSRKTAYVRVSFSAAPEPEVDEALKRLREAIIAARATNKK